MNIEEMLNAINGTLETQLKRQNEIMQQMYDMMPRPAGKITRVLETALLIVGISSIIGIADIIMKWFIGG